MTFEKLKLNKAVTYARLLGFEPFGNAFKATRHYHWVMPDGNDTFSIHVNYLSYTVNNTNTTSLERACELLQEIERKQKQHVTDMLRAEKVGR